MLPPPGNVQSRSCAVNTNTHQEEITININTTSTDSLAGENPPSISGGASGTERLGSDLYPSPKAGCCFIRDPDAPNANRRWQARRCEQDPNPECSRQTGEPATPSRGSSRHGEETRATEDADIIDVYWHNLAADHDDSPGIFIGMRDLYEGSVDYYVCGISRFLNRTAGVLRLHSVSIFPRSAVVVVDTQLTALYVRAAMRYSGMSPPNLYHIPGFGDAHSA